MKKSSFIYIVVIMCVSIVACYKDSALNPTGPKGTSGNHYIANARFDYNDPIHSGFIAMDSANKMINSYLSSINSSSNDSDIHSFIINADSLRNYLNNTNITNIKISLAHTLAYINGGHNGQYAGYQSGALTIIISGFNASGDYVYFNGSSVLDHASPCPTYCPSIGNATNDILK